MYLWNILFLHIQKVDSMLLLNNGHFVEELYYRWFYLYLVGHPIMQEEEIKTIQNKWNSSQNGNHFVP